MVVSLYKTTLSLVDYSYEFFTGINFNIEEEDNFETTDIKDVSNIWNFRSDGGAHYIGFNQFKKWRNPIEKEEQYRYRKK